MRRSGRESFVAVMETADLQEGDDPNVCRNCWPASLAWPRLPRPEGSKALAVPLHHRVRLDDRHRSKTAGPEAVEQNPEGSIEPRQAGLSSRPASKDFQLMTKSDDLDLHISSPSEAGMEAVGKGTKDSVHALNAMAHHRETPGFPRRMEFMGGTSCPMNRVHLSSEESQVGWAARPRART